MPTKVSPPGTNKRVDKITNVKELQKQKDVLHNDFREALEIIEAAYFVIRMNKFYLSTAESAENDNLISVEMHISKNQRKQIEKLNDDIINFLTEFKSKNNERQADEK